jgi:hypothetical protein
MKRLLASLLCGLAALGIATAGAQKPTPFSEEQFKASGHKPIAAAKLKEMLVGNTGYEAYLEDAGQATADSVNTYYWKTADRVIYAVTHRDTGKRLVRPTTWSIQGDAYCIQVLVGGPPSQATGRPDERPGGPGNAFARPPAPSSPAQATTKVCLTLYDLGGVIYACTASGKCHSLLRIVPGNPENF